MKRFDIITEADARLLDIGSTVELTRGGVVTPLARDTLAGRRVTVVAAGSLDPAAADLVPAAAIARVAVGADHTGVQLKHLLVGHLRGRGLSVADLGTSSTEAVDYPDIAGAVALAVARKEADAGIAIDGAGIGSAILRPSFRHQPGDLPEHAVHRWRRRLLDGHPRSRHFRLRDACRLRIWRRRSGE
jgi:hypothetical protein